MHVEDAIIVGQVVMPIIQAVILFIFANHNIVTFPCPRSYTRSMLPGLFSPIIFITPNNFASFKVDRACWRRSNFIYFYQIQLTAILYYVRVQLVPGRNLPLCCTLTLIAMQCTND